MKRAIVLPADVSAAPLSDLRDWLGISNNNEEALLMNLLRASLDMCEAFTGHMPLESQCEEMLSNLAGWQRLSAAPVQAVTSVEHVDEDGVRMPLDPADYAIEIDHDGTGKVHLANQQSARAIAVRYAAGLADNWYNLPDPLKHGIVRLAAYNYRDRDTVAAQKPPTSVAALWRPWRALRLA